ncbi:MAG: rhodanese-like domain-containing protein [Methylomicrobium sp.]
MSYLSSKILLAGLGSLAISTAMADTTGNRYGYPVLYESEISAASAWLHTSQNKWNKSKPHAPGIDENSKSKKPVILDVRRIEEYVAGHPPGAYNIPFPHVTGSPDIANDSNGYIGYDISIDPEVGFLTVDGKDGTLPIEDFVAYVESVFPDKDQPLYILCATGHRSVQAANALAKYGHYTHVKNIWEGYNGQPKYAYTGAVPTQPLVQLDLNNDGVVDGNDRDGWAYFQDLPTETKIKSKLIFQPYLSLYPQN